MAKGRRAIITRGAMLLIFGKKHVKLKTFWKEKSILKIELHFISQGQLNYKKLFESTKGKQH
jgi:uncharacterized membrane protein (UPF0127 family)